MTTTCHCGRPTRRAIAPTAEVTDADSTLRLDGVGVYVCDRGHATVADDEVAARVVAAIRDGLLQARRRRLRRHDACGDCGADLVLLGRRTDTPVPTTTPFGVVTPTLDATMLRCPDCGREQLPPDVVARLPALVEAAVATVGR